MNSLKIVKKTIHNNRPTKVYDFTVEGDHHYILSNGLISHNSYFPTKEMGGGGGLKYAASTIIYLSKKKDKVDNEVVGSIIHCKTYKSRKTKQDKTVDVQLNYDTGLNEYYGLLDIAIKHGIFTKVSTKIDVGSGKTVFENQILKNPEKFFTSDVMVKLEEAVKKEFCYGNDIEEEASEVTPTAKV